MENVLSALRLRHAKLDIFACPLPQVVLTAPANPSNAVTELVDDREAESLADHETGFLSQADVKARRASGEQLLVTRVGDARACYCWIQRRQFMLRFIDQRFLLPPGSAHIAFLFTPPEFRGQGMGRLTVYNIVQRLAAEGVKWVFAEVEPDNTPSIRSVQASGFRKYATLTYWRLVFLRFYSVRGESGQSWSFWRLRKNDTPEMDNAFFGHRIREAGKSEELS